MYEQIVLDAFRWVMARVDQTTWNLVRDDRENLEVFFTQVIRLSADENVVRMAKIALQYL